MKSKINFGRRFFLMPAQAMTARLDNAVHSSERKVLLHISDRCLVAQGVTCDCCRDTCEPNAIVKSFRMGIKPAIDGALCTQCAECVAVCPVNAIVLDKNFQCQGDDV